ncbi:Afadin and alpha-actinin-binding-domain-containing protein [Venturia nashicola]|uniref:Afadin and alpha-actinin-binding-domain-containing protein n=1 Tax=Venturia nashicola TaxID=86259 RepID=A0A4Z1PUJ1_9PEZI|nr:Afadin and alpha-actinin-binding-domain-containing protein [Venturia nashicola]
MDSQNLKAASAYINNLLLARGLLRNGKSVEFARPSKGEGGTEATMAQIINLVHDMILRRDREQEQKESLAQTLRTLRTESTHNTIAIERLQTRNDDLTRQNSLAQSQERSARAALKTAEISARGLREEMARLKATVQQIRTACANDVRKRDVQIQKLKTHLTSQQRGNKTGLMGASITISPSMNGMAMLNSAKDDSPDVEDPEYNLRQETTDFLTQLSQSLSDENDNLIGLVRTTLSTLKEVQGLPENMARAGLEEIGEDDLQDEHMLHALPTSYDALATDMHSVLDSLRSLLTNPNFVPIEEVSVREEEILRLRAGWEMMEAKWREAIVMMDGWRKRMLSGGDTVNVDELRLGLGLGAGLASTAVANDDTEEVEGDSLEDDISVAEYQEEDTEEMDLLPEPDVVEEATKPQEPVRNSRTRRSPRLQKPLRETNANSPRKVSFASSKPNTPDLNEKSAAPKSRSRNLVNVPTPSLKRPTPAGPRQKSPSSSKKEDSRAPRKTLKRLSSPGPQPEERSPKLTTQEKLNIAQAEAEAAAVKAGLDLDHVDLRIEGLEDEEDEDVDELARKETHELARKKETMPPPPVPQPREKTKVMERKEEDGGKRKSKSGRSRRRKSTLTPEELEKLMNLD